MNMKIGLIRHFKVNLKKNRFMTSKEYNQYMFEYDRSEVIPNEVVIDKEWDKCYCSTLSRAMTTAKTVYDGEIITTDKLIEIPSAAWKDTNIRVPYILWTILNRIAWTRNHMSQPEGRKVTIKRINEIMDLILKEKDKNILIVSHAGTLYEIQKILIGKGFRGDHFIKPRNGKLYIFKNRELK